MLNKKGLWVTDAKALKASNMAQKLKEQEDNIKVLKVAYSNGALAPPPGAPTSASGSSTALTEQVSQERYAAAFGSLFGTQD